MDNRKKGTPYGRIKSTIGGFIMPREYRHIKQYENELLDLRNQGLTYKEIADRMGFSKKQILRFFERYRIKQRKTSAGQAINKKGRPCKKDNELMRVFLSLQKGCEDIDKISSNL